MKHFKLLLAVVASLVMMVSVAIAETPSFRVYEDSSGKELETFLAKYRENGWANEVNISTRVLGFFAFKKAKESGFINYVNLEVPVDPEGKVNENDMANKYAELFKKWNDIDGDSITIDRFVRRGQGIGFWLPVTLSEAQAARKATEAEQKAAAAKIAKIEADVEKVLSQLVQAGETQGRFNSETRDKLAGFAGELETQSAALGAVTAENARLLGQIAELRSTLKARDANLSSLSQQLTDTKEARADWEKGIEGRLSAVETRQDSFAEDLNLTLIEVTENRDNIGNLDDQLNGEGGVMARLTALEGVVNGAEGVPGLAAQVKSNTDTIGDDQSGLKAEFGALDKFVRGDGTDANPGLPTKQDLADSQGEPLGWEQIFGLVFGILLFIAASIWGLFLVFATKKGVKDAVAEVTETADAISDLVVASSGGWSSSNMTVGDLMLRSEADGPVVWKGTMAGREYALQISRRDNAPNRLFTNLPGCPGYGAKNFEVKALNALQKAVRAGEVTPVAAATAA